MGRNKAHFGTDDRHTLMGREKWIHSFGSLNGTSKGHGSLAKASLLGTQVSGYIHLSSPMWTPLPGVAPGPVALEDVRASFKNARTAGVTEILEIMASLGQVRKVNDGVFQAA